MRRIICMVVASLLATLFADAAPLESPWQPAEGEDGLLTRTLILAEGESNLEFTLDASEAGYVLMPESAPANISISWFDEEDELAKGTARFGFSDGIVGRLTRTDESTEPIEIQLTWWPEMDVTEPNDDPLLAWPIELYQVNSTFLFPAGDQDAFRFTLEDEMSVLLSFQNQEITPSIQYINLKTEAVVSYEAGARLPAGEYAVIVSATGTNTQTPEPLGFALIRRDPVEMDNPEGAVLTVGAPWNLGFADGSTQTVDLTLTEPGFYSFLVSNSGDQTQVMVTNSDGWSSSADMHLAPGDYQITISGRALTGLPGFLTVERTPMGTDAEPNDFITEAVPFDPGDVLEFTSEAKGLTEWFSFPVATAGDHFLRVRSTGEYCATFFAGVSTSLNNYRRLDVIGSGEFRVFGPLTVAEEQVGSEQAFYIGCEGAVVDSTYELTLVQPGQEVEASSGTTDSGSVYVVGVELTDGLSNQLAAASENASVAFLQAEEAQDLSERIEDIVEAEEARDGFSWWWLLVLIAAVLGAGWLWRRSTAQ